MKHLLQTLTAAFSAQRTLVKSAILLGSSLIFAILIETFIFNGFYFSFDEGKFTRQEINLPFAQSLGRSGVILTPEHAQLTINSIEKPVQTVLIETYGTNRQLVHGTLLCTDDGSRYQLNAVTDFKVVPTDSELNSYLARVINKGNLHQLTLSFDQNDLRAGLAVTGIVLNAAPEFNFSAARVLLMTVIFSLVLCFAVFKWYAVELDFRKRSQRLINYGLLAFCIGIAGSFFYLLSPTHSTNLVFDIYGIGTVPTSNPYHSLLLPRPANLEELSNSDAYVQLMDAFLKGQLNLDVYVDPKLAQLPNPYDPSARAHANVNEYWDRPYFEGKYYVYFGLAPLLTVYAPIYFITGMMPALQLADFLLASLAIIAWFTALRCLYAVFKPRTSAVLYFLGEVGVVCGAMIYFNQTAITHYTLPYLSVSAWLCFFTASLYGTLLPLSLKLRRVLYAAAGLCVVMIVLSRPLTLLFAITLSLPLVIMVFTDRTRAVRERLLNFACLAVPTLLGAIFVMWYNYARFHSIFEFGQFNQLTGLDVHYNSGLFNLSALSNALYHFFIEDLQPSKEFPFVQLTTVLYRDFGNFLFAAARFGFFAIPLTAALALGLLLFKKPQPGSALPAEGRLLTVERWTFALTVLAIPCIAYLEYANAGLSGHYTIELLNPAMLLGFLLLLQFVHLDGSRSSLIVYALALYLIGKTIFLGYFSAFLCEGMNYVAGLNPEYYAALERFFMPLRF